MIYRKHLLGLLLLFSVFGLSACSLGKDKAEENWQEDILLAEECGEDGLQCCIDKDPACKYGSCCVDPNDPAKNYCSESCEFGKENTFCRAGDECDEGLACSVSYCRLCGGEGQPCCGTGDCDGSLACFRDTCVACGVTGNPCCLDEPFCLDESSKDLDRSQCKEEICSLCGAGGNEPCVKEPVCNDNHLMNMGLCYRCGGFNQPCCQKKNDDDIEKYCVEEGLSCKLDFCSK